METRKVEIKTLLLGLTVALAFSMLLGYTAGAMGFGSRYPQMNLIAKPWVCPNQEMSYAGQVSTIGSTKYWTAKWYCGDSRSGAKTELDSDAVFLGAGLFYGLGIFALLLCVIPLYWNSSWGPAKNDGLRLW